MTKTSGPVIDHTFSYISTMHCYKFHEIVEEYEGDVCVCFVSVMTKVHYN